MIGLESETEREQADAVERLRLVVDIVLDGVITIDARGTITTFNSSAERLFGYTATEVIGQNVKMLMPEPHHGRHDGYLANYLRAGQAKIIGIGRELMGRRKDGRTFPIFLAVSEFRTSDGRFFIGIVRDLTERKRAEDALAKNNERLRILHQIDKALIGAEGPEAIAAAALPPLRELLGVARTIVSLFDLPAGEVEWLAAAGRRRVRVGPGIRYSIRLMGDMEALRRGEPQFIDVHALPPSPEVDAMLASGIHMYAVVPMIANGELIGALSFGGASGEYSTEQLSIAQEAAAQFAIALMHARLHEHAKRQAQELQSAFEDTNVAMVWTDINHRFVRVNAAFARMFGYSQEEMRGMSMPDVTHPDDFVESFARRELLKAGQISHFQIEKRYLHKDGHVLWGLANVSLIRDAQGQPFQYVGQVQDITERKRTEDALRAAQRRLEHVISSSPAILFTWAVVRESLVPIWTSDTVKELMGYVAAETLQPTWWTDHMHPEDLHRVNAQICELLLVQGRAIMEFRFRHADGSYRWLRSENRLLRDAQGKPVEVVGSWSDITEHKQLEERYRQVQKMEAVGQLAGGVAHDFNNLLTVINGYSDIMQTVLPADSPVRELAREIGRAGNRAASLTRQLLAFSRKQVLKPEVLNLNTVVTDTTKMLQRLIGEDVDFECKLDSTLGLTKADPGQMEQVLLNLAVNARDAMPQGGKLTIETTNVDLDETYTQAYRDLPPGPYVMLAVSDTGIGMDEATKAHLFEPFFTTKGPGKGTGLGLATVFGIVKQSGGHVAVYSEPGRGTTVKVYLPLVEGTYSPTKSQHGLKPGLMGTETILLTEDEPAVRALTSHVLQLKGYTILEAGDGRQAIRIAEDHKGRIDLLVTDVVMPTMSGPQLAEQLTALRPGTKVLYLSGYTDDAVVRHGVLQADTAFLQKPFTPTTLAQKVREVLDQ